MRSPYTGRPMVLKKDKRKLSFRKEEFDILYHSFVCSDTKEEFETEDLLKINLAQVHNQYRAKHNLPFPEEIIEIREKYGVSASQMSKILNLGINSYRKYENGEIPSLSNARLIQLVSNAEEFKKLIELNDDLNSNSRERLLGRLNKMIISEKISSNFNLEEYLLGSLLPDQYRGYRRPNLEKFFNILNFFSDRLKPWKVKMCKLLFYVDFGYFKRYGYSISGLKYIAISMGPVPNNFDGLFNEARQRSFIKVEYKSFKNGGIGEQFIKGDQPFDASLFSDNELNTLNQVFEKFGSASTKEIIDLSHQETAWKNCFQKNSFISYHYGYDLKGDE